MKRLTYKKSALLGDLARGGLGLVICAGPLILVEDPLVFVQWILWIATAIFSFFVLRTLLRSRTEVQFSADEMRMVTPLSQKTVTIGGLSRVKLSHYAGPRARPGDGVTQLSLWDGGTKIIVESSLNEFDTVLEAIAAICRSRKDIEVDIDSVHNFKALGISVEPGVGGSASQNTPDLFDGGHR